MKIISFIYLAYNSLKLSNNLKHPVQNYWHDPVTESSGFFDNHGNIFGFKNNCLEEIRPLYENIPYFRHFQVYNNTKIINYHNCQNHCTFLQSCSQKQKIFQWNDTTLKEHYDSKNIFYRMNHFGHVYAFDTEKWIQKTPKVLSFLQSDEFLQDVYFGKNDQMILLSSHDKIYFVENFELKDVFCISEPSNCIKMHCQQYESYFYIGIQFANNKLITYSFLRVNDASYRFFHSNILHLKENIHDYHLCYPNIYILSSLSFQIFQLKQFDYTPELLCKRYLPRNMIPDSFHLCNGSIYFNGKKEISFFRLIQEKKSI